jgi:hypothetical protein
VIGAVRHRIARLVRPNALNAYERRWSSQNGEDGILREIFRRLGSGDRTFVEFGVGDGRECNAAALIRRGWRGMLLEGDPASYAALRATYAGRSGVTLVPAFVTAENIVAIFRRHAIPLTFDLLSIDVDGNDYWIWEALAAYHPRVVTIEYNAAHPPPERWVMAYAPAHRWAGDGYYGASLESLAALATRLGYALIGTDEHGVNAFFIRDDLLAQARFPRLSAAQAYHRNAYGQARTDGPFVER